MRPLPAALAWTVLALTFDIGSAAAQEPGRVYKIGLLWIGRPGWVSPPIEKWTGEAAIIRDRLRDAGYVVGKNLVIDARHVNGDAARLGAEAEALVTSGVDVITTNGTPPTVAAMQATKSIPIVFWGVGDPIDKGIVESLARPGGNVTGMAVLIALAKQWHLLHEAAPAVRRAGFLGNAANRPAEDRQAAWEATWLERMRADAAAVGIEPIRMRVYTLADVKTRFAELASGGAAGVVVSQDALLVSPEWRPFIMEMALSYRLPTSCAQQHSWAESGCLVTYTEDWNAVLRGFTAQVVKVLRGTRPADIPVEQPTSYKLVINAKTAKALELTLPSAFLALADEVIE